MLGSSWGGGEAEWGRGGRGGETRSDSGRGGGVLGWGWGGAETECGRRSCRGGETGWGWGGRRRGGSLECRPVGVCFGRRTRRIRCSRPARGDAHVIGDDGKRRARARGNSAALSSTPLRDEEATGMGRCGCGFGYTSTAATKRTGCVRRLHSVTISHPLPRRRFGVHHPRPRDETDWRSHRWRGGEVERRDGPASASANDLHDDVSRGHPAALQLGRRRWGSGDRGLAAAQIGTVDTGTIRTTVSTTTTANVVTAVAVPVAVAPAAAAAAAAVVERHAVMGVGGGPRAPSMSVSVAGLRAEDVGPPGRVVGWLRRLGRTGQLRELGGLKAPGGLGRALGGAVLTWRRRDKREGRKAGGREAKGRVRGQQGSYASASVARGG